MTQSGQLSVNRPEVGPPVYRVIAWLARTFTPMLARVRSKGQENIPFGGPALVVANHISNFDPIVLGDFVIRHGRWPRFLGKADIWNVPVLGWVARKCDQIPVYRGSDRAGESLIHAEEALRAGKIVAIYPEGTITGDPDGWPMTGRRGAAYLALATGVPVIPVAQVGADAVLGGKRIDVRRIFGRRKDIEIWAGPPIDLTRFAGRAESKQALDDVTTIILDTLAAMRGELLGIVPPDERFDIRLGRRVPIERPSDE